ncbi:MULTISPECIES: CcdB family protein [Marinobacter]|uniref:Toxin CcdB n=3 Tax=Marinobacter TaxID=2742 RepID=A0A1M2UVN3_MARNT|nr:MULTISPECIES: CcdB family protein [Marinobacter]MDX5439115.1 CcdB family protein [Alteromonadaceae bacterium]AMQ88419.1 plasmid maintenance protein CcdB [Marinobacter sp. LQ44]MBE0487045.1 CcdB family protein [Marinobacter sp.]MDX5334500.1 CcdB family protein [Marinobacter sp.]MDX5384963.1 CcdB family protein [Marinobacter sp.]
MARFDIFENKDGAGYLLDVQSDLLSGLNTRVVVPLLPKSSAPSPAQRLNPVFNIEGQEVVMATQYMAAVPEGELRFGAGSLAGQQDEISAALDMLFLGF